jgi:hypothetical protein
MAALTRLKASAVYFSGETTNLIKTLQLIHRIGTAHHPIYKTGPKIPGSNKRLVCAGTPTKKIKVLLH